MIFADWAVMGVGWLEGLGRRAVAAHQDAPGSAVRLDSGWAGRRMPSAPSSQFQRKACTEHCSGSPCAGRDGTTAWRRRPLPLTGSLLRLAILFFSITPIARLADHGCSSSHRFLPAAGPQPGAGRERKVQALHVEEGAHGERRGWRLLGSAGCEASIGACFSWALRALGLADTSRFWGPH